MNPTDYFIGQFSFFSMDGFPEVAKQRPTVEARSGNDGHDLWLTGFRGEPVTVTTYRDCVDLTDSANTYRNYRDLVGFTVPVIYSGRQFESPFDVLGVTVQKEKKVAIGIGGRQSKSGVLLVCQWNLIATVLPNQPAE